MKQFSSSDLKTILHSKRANIYHLEHCRVMQKDGRILYLTESKNENQYWNIPIANTTCLLLGTGTSITQAATRMLAQAGVLIGFCGGGGTPLLMSNEIEWLTFNIIRHNIVVLFHSKYLHAHTIQHTARLYRLVICGP